MEICCGDEIFGSIEYDENLEWDRLIFSVGATGIDEDLIGVVCLDGDDCLLEGNNERKLKTNKQNNINKTIKSIWNRAYSINNHVSVLNFFHIIR